MTREEARSIAALLQRPTWPEQLTDMVPDGTPIEEVYMLGVISNLQAQAHEHRHNVQTSLQAAEHAETEAARHRSTAEVYGHLSAAETLAAEHLLTWWEE